MYQLSTNFTLDMHGKQCYSKLSDMQLDALNVQYRLRSQNLEPCLDVLADVALKAAEQDLALARLQAVHHGGDGTLQISPREQYQLLHGSKTPCQATTPCFLQLSALTSGQVVPNP